MELHYYQENVNAGVVSEVAEGRRSKDCRKLGKIKKVPKMLEFDGQFPVVYPKVKFWHFLEKIAKN